MKSSFLSLLFSLFWVTPAGAATNPFDSAGKNLGKITGVAGPGGQANLPNIISFLLQSILGVLGIVAVAYMIYSGFIYFTAEGKDDVEKAKKTMIYLFFGILIIMSSLAISRFIFNQIIIPGTSA